MTKIRTIIIIYIIKQLQYNEVGVAIQGPQRTAFRSAWESVTQKALGGNFLLEELMKRSFWSEQRCR